MGNETRLAILQSLFDAEEWRMSYSQLMDGVGIRDSGKFNFHLSKLVGPFVRKIEEGYELKHAGVQIIGAILSGTYHGERSLGPVELGSACRQCDGSLIAVYEGGFASIECEDCRAVVTRDGVPPGIFEGVEAPEMPTVFGRWLRHRYTQLVDEGFCLICAGRTDRSLGTPEHEAIGGLGVELRCRRCGMRFTAGLGSLVLGHPAVVSFYREQGIDLRRVPLWELAWINGETADTVAEGGGTNLVIVVGDQRLDIHLSPELTVDSATILPR
ncbi:MAG: hypothetical protein R3324_16495 [Halobacteriales archaeon]|nr:hypothetical protein [Halobacteriales archaeon]